MLRTALIIDGNSEGGQRALQQLEASIERNEKEARQLAAAYSAADIATTRLAQAQAAAKTATDASKAAFVAGEISLEEYTRQLLETRTAVGLVSAEHRSTVAELSRTRAAYAAATGGGQQFTRSMGEQRIGAQQLAMNLSDVSTMFALGARPMQIFASQAGQVIQSIQLMTGGTSRFAAFMLSGWGTAITAGAMVLIPLVGYLLDTKDAAEEAEDAQKALAYAADSLGRAQNLLAGFIDLATGKQISQNEVTREAIRLQAELARLEAVRAGRDAGKALQALRPDLVRDPGAQGLYTAARIPGLQPLPTAESAVGQMQFDEALRTFLRDPKASVTDFRKAIQGIPGVDVNAAMQQAIVLGGARNDARNMRDVMRVIDGDRSALPQFLKPGSDRTRRGAQGPSAEDIERRFEDELHGYTQQALGAKQQMAISAAERAELEMRGIEWDRRQSLAKIKADEDYNAAQKAQLAEAAEHLAELQRSAVDFELRRAQEQEAQQLADARHQAMRDSLQVQLDLVGTEADRKSLALQIYEAETAYLRAKLEAIAASETATEAEKQRAQIELASLNALAGTRRDAVARGNATSVERYLDELNRTPEQIGEAIDRIKIDGLETLSDGIVDAIKHFDDLGDVAEDVADQIISSLLRIAVQQAIIQPLANALFPGAGGPANLLAGTPYGGSGGGGLLGALGSLFGGGRAGGGPVSPGRFYAVNERSTAPGLFIPLSPGRIEPPGGAPSSAGAPALIEVRVSGSEIFHTEVRQISGEAAVQVVQGFAPEIIGAAVNETTRVLTRQRM